MLGLWGAGGHVAAIGSDIRRAGVGPRARRLHQMRSDLGRLGASAEILQIGPFLGAIARSLPRGALIRRRKPLSDKIVSKQPDMQAANPLSRVGARSRPTLGARAGAVLYRAKLQGGCG